MDKFDFLNVDHKFDTNLLEAFSFNVVNGSLSADFSDYKVDTCALWLGSTELQITIYVTPIVTAIALLVNALSLFPLIILARRHFPPYTFLVLLGALNCLIAAHEWLNLNTTDRPLQRLRNSSPVACHLVLYCEGVLHQAHNWMLVVYFLVIHKMKVFCSVQIVWIVIIRF